MLQVSEGRICDSWCQERQYTFRTWKMDNICLNVKECIGLVLYLNEGENEWGLTWQCMWN